MHAATAWEAAAAGTAAPQPVRNLGLAATDGFPLALTLHGDPGAARAGVLLVGAMGVEQSFYTPFAEWLAAQGYLVASFDFRGIGRSRPPACARSLRGFEADIGTWTARDLPAVIDHLAGELGPRPLYWVGHSLGAQVFGMVPNRSRVGAVVAVAAGTGYWPHNAPAVRWRAALAWYLLVPPLIALAGYFPGRRLGFIGDLPAGVMRQFRRWCLRRDYLVAVEGPALRAQYAAERTPMLWLSFTDDEMISRTGIDAMRRLYAGAPIEARHLAPAEAGLPRIGHFGFFRRPAASLLWPLAAGFLGRQQAAGDKVATSPAQTGPGKETA